MDFILRACGLRRDAPPTPCLGLCYGILALGFELTTYLSVVWTCVEFLQVVGMFANDLPTTDHVEIRVGPTVTSLVLHPEDGATPVRYGVRNKIDWWMPRCLGHATGLAVAQSCARGKLRTAVEIFCFRGALCALMNLLLRGVAMRHFLRRTPPPRKNPRGAAALLWLMKRRRRFKGDDGGGIAGDEDEQSCCAICLADKSDGSGAWCTTSCGHGFHEACMQQWITKGCSDCPLCRTPQRLRTFLWQELYHTTTSTKKYI